MDQQRLMMMRKEYLTLMGLNFTMESVLDDPALLQPIVDFYTFTCHWLKGLHRDAPGLLARVPEFIVEDIAKLLLYLTHAKIRRANMHDDATRIVVDPEIITVLIVLMGENRVKNPHLRATIADVLLWLCRPDLGSFYGSLLHGPPLNKLTVQYSESWCRTIEWLDDGVGRPVEEKS
jgi:hypothetical protein